MSTKLIGLSLLAASLALSGCATPTLRQVQNHQHHILARVYKPEVGVTEVPGPYIATHAVRYNAIRHPVSINAHHAPIGSLMEAVAARRGDSVFFTDGAHPTARITAVIHRSRFSSAVRTLAEAAGYASVIRPHRKEVIITPRATYFFRVPTSLFTAGSGAYMIGGNTAVSGSSSGSSGGSSGISGGGGGMPGGSSGSSGSSGGSAGSSMTAEFTVNGKTHVEKVPALQKSLAALAGKGSHVSINETTGIISVTADGRGLARSMTWIRHYVRSADTRVQIHVAVLEVSLTNGFQWGINWSKIASLAGAATTLNFSNTAPVLGTPAATANTSTTGASTVNYTGSSVTALITALRTVTNVRIVSEPSLVVEDGTPSTLFSGTKLPYVGSVSSNVTGLSGTSSTGAGLSYALNGLSLSVVPDVLDGRLVHLTLVPALSEINQFDTFTVDGNQLQGPVQNLRQVYIQVLVPSGRTLIIGGSRQMSSTDQSNETPGLGQIPYFGDLFKGVADNGVVEQLVILVRANILAPPHFDPLIGESL